MCHKRTRLVLFYILLHHNNTLCRKARNRVLTIASIFQNFQLEPTQFRK